MCAENKFDTIEVGNSYTLERTISEEMVQLFADFTGDYNPVHMNEKYCLEHHMETRIVHGMLVLSFLSTLIGMHLPGEGSVWMSQSVDFISPVAIGDSIQITGTVVDKNKLNALGLSIISLKIEIRNKTGKLAARGIVKVSV